MKVALIHNKQVIEIKTVADRAEADAWLRARVTSDLVEYVLVGLLRVATPRMVSTLQSIDEVDQ